MAILTNSDLQLEDTQNKEWYAQEYGYDYSENAAIQNKIHAMVSAEVDMGVEDMAGEKSLAPRTGRVNFNGSMFTITQQDRDAYCARFPQVCKTGSARDSVLDTLRGGMSTAPRVPATTLGEPADATPAEDAQPAETEEAEETAEPTTSLGDSGAGNDSSSSSSSDTPTTTTPQLPPPPSTATHTVATRGGRLAFRDLPASTNVSEVASEDTDKKGELIDMLNNGTPFVVLDPGCGYQCQWHHIKYNNVEGYIYNKFVEEIPSSGHTYLEYDCESPKDSAFVLPSDWTTKELNTPYRDSESGKWAVAFETEHESTGGSELQERMLNSRTEATRLILSELGKDTSDEYVDSVVSAAAAIRVEDYYVSTRRGENMRVLVTLPVKYVSKLRDQTPIIPEVFDGEVQVQNSNYRSGTTKHIVLCLDQDNSYRERIQRVAQGMDAYATQIDSYDGEVRGLDFRQEADRLMLLIQRINLLLTANKRPTHGPNFIEIGLDDDYRLVFAAENHRGFYQQLTAGWDTFVDSEPLDSQRSMKYLFYLWDMEDAIFEEMDWIEFVGRFTDYEVVEIFPSSSASESPSDITNDGNQNNPSSSGNTAADRVDKEISPDEEPPDSCYDNLSIKGMTQGVLRRPKSLKGAAEKITEDIILGGADVRKSVRDEALATADFVGEPLLSDIFNQVGRIDDLDDVFEVVLNKISLMDLVGAILACFNLEFKVDLDIPLPLRFECLKLPKVPTIQFPDNLPTMDIMADLSKAIFDGIIQALTEAFVTMIKDLVLSMLELCEEAAEDNIANINDAIDEKNNNDSINPDEAEKKGNQDKLAVLAAAGLLSGNYNKPTSPEEKENRLNDLADLLGDVSLLIPPSELCRLLKGEAAPKTLSITRSLIKRKYPSFAGVLKTKTKIKDFMKLVGKLVDSRFCDALAKAPRTKFGTDTTCDVIDFYDDSAAQNMRIKGDGITEDQILEQLDRAKERRKKRAESMKDLVGKLVDLQTGRANPFQDSMSPLFCGKDSNGAPVPGLIELKHDSISFMMDKVLDTVFEPVYMAFNRDVKSYQAAMITGTNEKREIPAAREIENDSGEKTWVWHPEIKRQEAMGVTFEFNKDFGEAKSKHADNLIEVEEGVRRVNTVTRDLLNNLESSGAFTVKYDNEGVYYELVLPPDPNTQRALQGLMDQFGGDAAYQDLDIEKLMTVMPDWKIRYKMPWQFLDKDYGQRIDDEYIIEIFPGETPSNSLGLRRDVEQTIDTEALNYIEDLYPAQAPKLYEPNPDAAPLEPDVFYTSKVSVSDVANKMGNIKVGVYTRNTDDPCGEDTVKVLEAEVPSSWYDPDISPTDAYDFAKTLSGEDRCLYIQMYMGQQHIAVWELLKELYEPCWSVERLETINTYKLPPQTAVFGLHAENVWRTRFVEDGSAITADHEKFLKHIRSHYTNRVHPQVTADIATLIAKQIADSILFKSEEIALPSSASDGMVSHTPYLEKIIFSREPTKFEKACGIDPHLLSVNDFKKAAKDEFENGGGFCSLIDGVDDDSKQDPMRDAMLKSVVQMTIRCYLIDYFLRGIFAFSEFSVEETLDDYVLEFMIKKMMEEMQTYESDYAELFFEYLSSKVRLPKKPADVSTEDTPTIMSSEDNEEGEEIWDSNPEENVINILKELFIHEFAVVAIEMRELWKDDPALKHINFENSSNLHDKILQEWLPVVDLSKGDEDVRFADVPPNFREVWGVGSIMKDTGFDAAMEISNVETEADKRTAFKYFKELSLAQVGETVRSDFATNRTYFEDNGLSFDLTNGNLFLETFYKLEKKSSIDAQDIAKTIIENYADEEFSIGGNSWVNRLNAVTEAVEAAWAHVFGGDPIVYLARTQIDEKMDDFIAKVVTDVGATSYYKTVGSGGNNPPTSVPVNYFTNIEGQLLDETSEVAKLVWKVENFFDGLSTGLRLCYVPPVGSEFYGDDDVQFGIKAPEGVVLDTVNSIAKKYKAFAVVESYETDSRTIIDTDSTADGVDLAFSQDGANDITHSRTLYTTPLIEVLNDSVWDDISDSNLIAISGSSLNEKNLWDSKYDSGEVEDLKNMMVETPEYKALFKFSIPTERFLGLLTVYTIMSTSASPNVEAIFGGTKDELYRVFMALSSSSYKVPEGPSNAELARVQDHFSGISTPCFSFSFGGTGGMPKGFGIDLILKLAIKTPMHIFKAIVEMIDPNIKIAKWIIDLARMVGVCLPMPLISLGLLPPTVFGFPPFGIGIGPPLTPLGFGYLALGFEIPLGNPFGGDDEDGDSSSTSDSEASEACMEKEKKKKEKIEALREKILSSRQK